jgi:transcriptional regulator with XRE-family HTH domain
MLKEQFSQDLMRHLLDNYGRMPSASVFARDFNLRAGNDKKAISQETARRWMRGISIPDYNRLTILVRWLNLEINELSTQNMLNNANEAFTLEEHNRGRRLNDAETSLLRLFRETDIRGKKILLGTANSILPGLIPPSLL